MAIRWSRASPQIALTPALVVTFVCFFGAILWTIYMSFTNSRRFPDYAIDLGGLRPAVRAPVRHARPG